MVTAAEIKRSLPYSGARDMLVNSRDQSTPKIIEYIGEQHRRDKASYDKIADQFWNQDARTTAKDLFNFCKKNIKYFVEPESDQTVKTPGRILIDGHGDCKHYSLFINGICDSLRRAGYPISSYYNFVSDSPDIDVHHVFAVIKDGNGNEIWADPVLDHFNIKPHYHNTKKLDMAISILSGTAAGEVI